MTERALKAAEFAPALRLARELWSRRPEGAVVAVLKRRLEARRRKP